MIRQWYRSPAVLKLLVGQHIVNGLSVSAGVAAVAIAAAVALGLPTGQIVALGAISASIGDYPAPLRNKSLTMSVGFGLAICATLLILMVESAPVALIAMIGAIAFVAGFITGLGRWALTLSMQILIPMVFILSLPATSFSGALRDEALFATGGIAYVAIALALTALTDAGGRRLMTSECLREFSTYLRAVSRFYEDSVDLPEAYGLVIRQQAALADQLLSARALLLDKPTRTPMRMRLAATIGILLDVLDSLIAAHVQLATLRGAPACRTLMERIRVTLRASAVDLDRMSLELLSNSAPRLPLDYGLASDALAREAGRLEANEALDERTRAAARATRESVVAALRHVRRLESALSDDEEARASLSGLDLAAFTPRPSFDLRLLKPHLSPESPVLRFAARLALAMAAGALVTHSISGVRHGYWVLLTTAVIMRASYGLTRQRRNDRVLGTLIGCLAAAALIAVAPIAVLIVVEVLALGVAHGFARLRYVVTATAASIVALLAVHLGEPGETATVLARLGDTLIGAALAHLFSHILPRWEFNEAPRLVARLQADIALFARTALDPAASDQDYRLARKRMIESLAALSDSAARMGGEPRTVRRGLDELADMLISGYVLAANVSATRLWTRTQRGGDAWPAAERRLETTRGWLIGLLAASTPQAGLDGPALVAGPPGPASAGEFLGLRRAALALMSAASRYRLAAAA